jgi:hypothetical protein
MTNTPAEYSAEHASFVEETNRTARIEAGVSRILENSAVKHQDDRATAVREIISKLQASGVTFRVADRGFVVPEKNGQPQNLQSLVENLLLTDRTIGDPASIQQAVANGQLEVQAKSDLSNASQKSAWLNKHSLAEWERLPLNRQGEINMDPHTMGRSDWNRLTTSQKVQLQKREDFTEQVFGQILKRN